MHICMCVHMYMYTHTYMDPAVIFHQSSLILLTYNTNQKWINTWIMPHLTVIYLSLRHPLDVLCVAYRENRRSTHVICNMHNTQESGSARRSRSQAQVSTRQTCTRLIFPS